MQLAGALRNAIDTGYYRPGDVLPPVRDLAHLLDLSKGIAEQAIAHLREEGLISPRPRIGSVVCEKNRPLWKGQILIIVPPDGGWDAVGLVQRATDEFAARQARTGRRWLPDLLFFRDDHLTTGALPALLAAGIRIPEDVRVVTWANRGLGPAFVKPFTRMEFDVVAVGETMARYVLEYLHTGTFPAGVVVGTVYKRGETFQ